ncbi:MAG: cytochrome c [Sulfuricella sp.]|nr:cytochrome c [Sulfuricella sp.]
MNSPLTAMTLGAILAAGVTCSQAASLEAGKISYAKHCAACHGMAVPTWSITAIRNAINDRRSPMKSMSLLSDAELQDIALYLTSTGGVNADRLFDWAEAHYPALLAPPAVSQSLAGYYGRYYTQSQLTLGVRAGMVYLYDANNSMAGFVGLGTLSSWLIKAGL